MIIAQVHESIVHLNDDFELVLGDKELHFILMAVLGMLLFFMVHFVFKRLAKWSITAVYLRVHRDDGDRPRHRNRPEDHGDG